MEPAQASRLVRVGQHHLRVADQGQGPPVLLLHGFPDSLDLWRHQWTPLVDAGYRVIAYDQRGYGDSDAPPTRDDYVLPKILDDALGVLDALGVTEKLRLVGHDWGAVVGWLLAGQYPDRFDRFVAVSVGHPTSYASAGIGQKLKAWYALAFRWEGVAERALSAKNFALFRRLLRHHTDVDRWIRDLSRPGRLTAALNWYRANWPALANPSFARVRVPTMGVWSSRDVALTENQMTGSAHFIDAPWRYERIEAASHWIPTEAAEQFNPLLLDYLRRPLRPAK